MMKRIFQGEQSAKNSLAGAITSNKRAKLSSKEDGKTSVVNDANDLNTSEFQDRYIKPAWLLPPNAVSKDDHRVCIKFHHSTDLRRDEVNACFDLVKKTSQSDYEGSSMPWSDKRKKRELMDPDMWFLLVTTAADDKSTTATPQGFLSFMLTHDSSPCVEVLYVYEIHLQDDLRGLGLGGHLMDVALKIAERVGVEKVMLTCFLSNRKAFDFYRRLGYLKDPTSPEDKITRKKIVKADYEIMGKNVHHQDSR